MDKAILFIFNILVNSLLSFFTLALILEGLLFVIKVPKGRFAAYIRMIPILKLPLDLFLYDFSKWAYIHQINPLLAEKGTRVLSAKLDFFHSSLHFEAPNNTSFSLADIFSNYLPSLALTIIALVIILCSCFFLLRLYTEYFLFRKTLSQNSESLFVAKLFCPKIYIPKTLSTHLSPKEFSAAIHHERAHQLFRDPLLKLLGLSIQAVFWWIPINWLKKRIEKCLEIGCDSRCIKQGINPLDLASALCKAAKLHLNNKVKFADHFAENILEYRVQKLLKNTPFKRRNLFCYLVIAICSFSLFIGKFWIF